MHGACNTLCCIVDTVILKFVHFPTPYRFHSIPESSLMMRTNHLCLLQVGCFTHLSFSDMLWCVCALGSVLTDAFKRLGVFCDSCELQMGRNKRIAQHFGMLPLKWMISMCRDRLVTYCEKRTCMLVICVMRGTLTGVG